MKHPHLLTILFLAATITQTSAQENLKIKTIPFDAVTGQTFITINVDSLCKPVYQAWVYTNSSNEPLRGTVWQTRDTTILFTDSESGSFNSTNRMTEIPVNNINKIAFREKGNRGKGVIAGAFLGVLLGALSAGGSGKQDPNAIAIFTHKQQVTAGIVVCAPIGALIGLAAGSKRKFGYFDGKQATYLGKRLWIEQHSMTRM